MIGFARKLFPTSEPLKCPITGGLRRYGVFAPSTDYNKVGLANGPHQTSCCWDNQLISLYFAWTPTPSATSLMNQRPSKRLWSTSITNSPRYKGTAQGLGQNLVANRRQCRVGAVEQACLPCPSSASSSSSSSSSILTQYVFALHAFIPSIPPCQSALLREYVPFLTRS